MPTIESKTSLTAEQIAWLAGFSQYMYDPKILSQCEAFLKTRDEKWFWQREHFHLIDGPFTVEGKTYQGQFLYQHKAYRGKLGLSVRLLVGVFYDDDNIVIAFRGSEHPLKHIENWLINFRFLAMPTRWSAQGADIHSGFKQAVTILWPSFRDALLRIIQAPRSDGSVAARKIYWTGHSLGAALTTVAYQRVMSLAAGDLSPYHRYRLFSKLPAHLFSDRETEMARFRPVAEVVAGVCTFASPICGVSAYATYIRRLSTDKPFQRVVIDGDPVTRLGKGSIGVPIGDLVPLVLENAPSEFAKHAMDNYQSLVKAASAAANLYSGSLAVGKGVLGSPPPVSPSSAFSDPAGIGLDMAGT